MLRSILAALSLIPVTRRTHEVDESSVTVYETDDRRLLRVERAPKSSGAGISLDVDEHDGEVTLGATLPLLGGRWATVYPGLGFFRALGMDWQTVRDLPDGVYMGQREVRIAVHSKRLWWSIWKPTHVYHSGDSRRGSVSVDPLDLLYGEERFEVREAGPPQRIPVAMPEATYHAVVTPSVTRATRPRGGPERTWVSQRVEVEEKSGIPIPGKGENPFDCSDDAIYAISVQARTPEDAVGMLVASALRARAHRQGTYGWEPSAPEPAPAVTA